MQGPKVKEFEESFAKYIGTKYAIAASSGTAALHMALLSNKIGKDSEVITSPLSFISTSNTILYVGAKPVYVDVDEASFNIDVKKIEEKITDKTKALMIVHLFGQPCDMRRIKETCNDHNLILIEDACQAHGAEFDGKKVGSFGTGCFSFYQTKKYDNWVPWCSFAPIEPQIWCALKN